MKTQLFKVTVLCIMLLMSIEKTIAQVTNPSNSGILGDYVGWQLGTSLNLDIVNEDPNPINFYTDAGSGSLNNLRMFIQGNDGHVGIGPSAPPAQVRDRDRLAY